jgi:hypothetical protein
MDNLVALTPPSIAEYLHKEVPWEWERLHSLEQLVSSSSDWAAACSDPRRSSYSSWLRETYRLFQAHTGIDGAA